MSSGIATESKLLAKHSLIYGLGNAINGLTAFILLPIYTKYLTPTDYGIKELVGLSANVISILLATAISSAIYRFYFEYEDLKERNEVISTALITIAIIGFFSIALLALASKTMAYYILDSSQLYYFFLIAFGSLWFQSLNNIGFNYLRANQQSFRFVYLTLGVLILTISLNIYFVCIIRIGVLGVLLSTLISSIMMSLFLVVPICFKTGFNFSFDKMKQMLVFGIPMIPSQFGAFIVHLSDRFFIKAFCSIADTGLYSLGYRFGALPLNFIAGPFNQTWQPRRFELYKNKDSEKVFGKIFTYFLCLMIFAGLAVSVLTKDILMLIADPKFWRAYKIVPIIVLATTIFSFHYHFNIGILIHKKTKYLAYINFSNGILILGLNFVLIPIYGLYGAAYATLIAFIYKVTLTYYLSSKFYKIHLEFKRIIKIIIAALLLYQITLFVHYESVYINLLINIFIVCLFPLFLLFFKFYTKQEKEKILELTRNGVNLVFNKS